MKQLQRLGAGRAGSNVQTIELSENAMPMERVVKLFTTAFEQICALKKWVLIASNPKFPSKLTFLKPFLERQRSLTILIKD